MCGYLRFDGDVRIPEERRGDFCRALDKIFYYGGMMHVEPYRSDGRALTLISPVRFRRGESVSFHFNYFEDDTLDDAGFAANTFRLFAGKVGDREFSFVMSAAFELYELYGEGLGVVSRGENAILVDDSVGWVSHLMGADFTLKRRLTHLWETVENLTWTSRHNPTVFVPSLYASAAVSCDFADLCYAAEGTDTLSEDEVREGTYPELVLKVKQALERHLRSCENRHEAVERVIGLIRCGRTQREEMCSGELGELAALSLEVPARVIAYLLFELTGEGFWHEWEKIKEGVYHDEVMRDFVPFITKVCREVMLIHPMERVRTSDFLRDDGLFTFWDTPKELQDVPLYYVSDADRLYWWDGSDEVIISSDCDAWLKGLADRHHELVLKLEGSAEDVGPSDADQAVRDLIDLFVKLDGHYKRLFPFKDMFYEFMRNATQIPWRAAIELIREVGDEMSEKGAVIRHLGKWDRTSKQVLFNEGRTAMKRLYAVMANRRLKERYFGF